MTNNLIEYLIKMSFKGGFRTLCAALCGIFAFAAMNALRWTSKEFFSALEMMEYVRYPAMPVFLALSIAFALTTRFMLGVLRDMYAEQESEHRQKLTQEAQFRALTENLPVGISIRDKKGKYVYVNPAFTKITGYEIAEVPEDEKWCREAFMDSEYGRINVEDWVSELDQSSSKNVLSRVNVIFCRSGSRKIVNFREFILENGNTMIVYDDITEQSQAEQALHTLISSSPIGIFIVQNGKFKMVNPGFEWITGYDRDYLLERDALEIVIPQHREQVRSNAIEMLKKAASREDEIGKSRIRPYEFKIITRDGREKTVYETVIPIYCRGNKATLGFFMDVTHQKRMEEEDMVLSEKMRSIGVLAGGIAHDFNNILTAILGNISLAKISREEEREKYFEGAEKGCLRATDLTKQLLTFSCGGKPVKTEALVRDILQESADLVFRGSSRDFTITVSEENQPVYFDAGQISQVINNLLINAIFASPESSIIEIKLENVTIGEHNALSLTAGDYVKVGIKDAGVGIPKEILPKIFDPFFTTKKNGTGLGLATAYSIIKSHGGCITVDSEVGEGTTFEFYLPVSQQEGKISTFREKPVLKKGNGETILIMDDEDDVLMVASKMTKRLGYRVETAKNGAVAIKKFIQAGQNNNPPIAAILMDLTIRGGMGGMETVRRILEIDPSAKVIVSSGYSDDTTMANFKKYGFAGCIAKPYRVETLGEELARVLRSV